ncbi:Helix-turn-helix domain-containing protein [Streptoalloteichus tenebrarius]|uniref:Helix-turn-helix domain-containing protein n=1 Tax=Streptoalloteichus tenebrarius (strain ATCC 17920 / DSM 40477 / JCM 4838 / CBS 697.72 / NBRC 16177 / NCIMB 11028 / NRRL B-12390 / A12253. 1 / ISP 5477) TaxID=1933 RepID=A0ABT1HPH2_STRSD|nr:Helix-turn-helix domain-containing protein [Streptoalloteichus tenebrarius]BFF04290.1 helix-turn-helix transcriptional regulator [Streptoalloteichus tenebrarius]
MRELAARLGIAHGTISRWETGTRLPRAEDVASYLTAVGVRDPSLREQIIDMAREDGPHWLFVGVPEQQRQLAALLDFERQATSITEVNPFLIPGLLQESSYVRGIMTGGGVRPSEVETRIALRLGRRDCITRRDQPANLTALIGEAAVRSLVGGPQGMHNQLTHLLDMAERPNIVVRVIPIESNWHPAMEGCFMLLEFDRHPAIIHLENRTSGMFLHEPNVVSAYRAALAMLDRFALSTEETFKLIAERLTTLERML